MTRSHTTSMSFMLCFACKIYKISISAQASLGEKFPKELNTLGDHLRATGVERGLKQWGSADMIGVREGTINKWERNHGEPRAVGVPMILRFLGYDPFPEPKCLRDHMALWRLRNGLSSTKASKRSEPGEGTGAPGNADFRKPAAGIARPLRR